MARARSPMLNQSRKPSNQVSSVGGVEGDEEECVKTVVRRRKPKECYGPEKSDGVREGQNK